MLALLIGSFGFAFGGGRAAAQDGNGADNPFFDVGDLVEEEAYPRLTVSGRVDVTWWHFESSKNVDGYKRNDLNLLSPALSFAYHHDERLSAHTELEFDGQEGELEIDNLFLRYAPRTASSAWDFEFDLGSEYIPFGIERYYYSPVSNPLVDRPSPFRRVYPGSYSDVGAFARADYTGVGWSSRTEVAVTRGLRGEDREDRGDGVLRAHDAPQASGRLGIEFTPRSLAPSWFGEAWGTWSAGVSGLYVDVPRRNGKGHRALDLLGVDVVWERTYESGSRSRLRFEYLEGGFEGRPTEGGSIRREGWYLEAYHRFELHRRWLEALEAVARYDSLDANSRVRDRYDVDRWAFGFNWIPHPRFRLKTEVVTSRERGRAIDNDGVFVQFEYHFTNRKLFPHD